MSDNKKDFDILDFATQTGKIIEDNFKVVVGLCGAALVAGSIFAYMKSAEKSRQEAAFTTLFETTKVYNEKKEKFDEAKAEKEKKATAKNDNKDSKKEEPKKNLVEATGDLEKDYGEVVKGLENFITSNTDTNAAGEAVLTLSEIYEEYKMPEKGAEALDKVLAKWSDKNVLYFVMQMRAGDLWAMAKQCDKSVSYWQKVADSDSFVAEQSQLKLGVCLQSIGRLDEAKQWFEKIQSKNPNSAEGFSAKRYLRFIEFQRKTGEGKEDSSKAQKEDNNQNTDKAS